MYIDPIEVELVRIYVGYVDLDILINTRLASYNSLDFELLYAGTFISSRLYLMFGQP